MSSKMFVVLALLVLVMSSAAFAVALNGYGYPPPSHGGAKPYPLQIDLSSTCEGNVVTVHRANSDETVSGAQVTITDVTGAPIFSGETDENGQITFEGCGMRIIIYASKPGYESEERMMELIACEQCEERGPVCGDGVCDQGETTENCPADCPPVGAAPPQGGEQPPPSEGGGPQFECMTDADCADAEYCALTAAAAGGTCEPVTGQCGYAYNHAWVTYVCGSEAGCASCQPGYECSNHVCVTVITGGAGAGTGAAPPAAGGEGGGEEGGADGFLLLLLGLLILLGLGALVWWFLLRGGRRH